MPADCKPQAITARCFAFLVVGLLTVGAAPATEPFPPIILRMPAPPADTATNRASPYTPAPVPNPDLGWHAPSVSPAHTELTPGFYHPQQGYRGDGFTPGSTIQGEEQRRYRPLPSLQLSMPLE